MSKKTKPGKRKKAVGRNKVDCFRAHVNGEVNWSGPTSAHITAHLESFCIPKRKMAKIERILNSIPDLTTESDVLMRIRGIEPKK